MYVKQMIEGRLEVLNAEENWTRESIEQGKKSLEKRQEALDKIQEEIIHLKERLTFESLLSSETIKPISASVKIDGISAGTLIYDEVARNKKD
jgi:uncharacterized protein YjgD (DUF1641 family)